MDASDREGGPEFMRELADALGLSEEWEAGGLALDGILLEVRRLRREAGEEGSERTGHPVHFRTALSAKLVVPMMRDEDAPLPEMAAIWVIAKAETAKVSSQIQGYPFKDQWIESPQESFSFMTDQAQLREIHRDLSTLIDRWDARA